MHSFENERDSKLYIAHKISINFDLNGYDNALTDPYHRNTISHALKKYCVI